MIDPASEGVSDEAWREATASCVEVPVAEVIRETHDACSLVFDVPAALRERFRYRAGQFLSFKLPYQGAVLTRSYSLASSPDCDPAPKVTVKRVDQGRISNWINDKVRAGDALMTVPPAGLFVLNDKSRPVTFFAGGSGITPCISLIKSALATTQRTLRLVYANRDERSIIFAAELRDLVARHPGRLRVEHSLDDRDGFLDLKKIEHMLVDSLEADFYLCGPGVFMDLVERALAALHVPAEQIHIERFVSPPDPATRGAAAPAAPVADAEGSPETLRVVLDGKEHTVPYKAGERVLAAVRRAGLEPPYSCEEGYCSCCMARLTEGEVQMAANDCLSPDLLKEGWVLTCQSVCKSRKIKIEYPN